MKMPKILLVPLLFGSHLKNDRYPLCGKLWDCWKLHQKVPDFQCILLEQINAFSQFNIDGRTHFCQDRPAQSFKNIFFLLYLKTVNLVPIPSVSVFNILFFF